MGTELAEHGFELASGEEPKRLIEFAHGFFVEPKSFATETQHIPELVIALPRAQSHWSLFPSIVRNR